LKFCCPFLWSKATRTTLPHIYYISFLSEAFLVFINFQIYSSRISIYRLVRDSSAVGRLIFFARAVGRQGALHKENSGFASPTLGRHISTFCGYRIFFYQKPLYKSLYQSFFYSFITILPQKVVLHSITTRFYLRSYYSAIWLPF
jgi:hypothetical protein